jgi:hypothetical protein
MDAAHASAADVYIASNLGFAETEASQVADFIGCGLPLGGQR